MRPARHKGPAMRVLSWNVASLRSLLTKVNPDCRAGHVNTEITSSFIVDHLLRG